MNEGLSRDFKGIWIPKEIWLDKELSLQEKIFIVEIDSLDNEEGCFATNSYFAEFFGLSKNRCSEVIKSLENKGLIAIKYFREKGKNNIEKRVIKLLDIPNRGIRNIDRPIRDIDRGYSGKGEENNTIVNNTINNIYIPVVEIIEHLNNKARTKYKATSNKTKELIKARFNEGFTLEDFKKAIDNKVSEWTGTDMEKYLRPETLFGNKFEGYLNQKSINKTNNSVKKDNFTNYEQRTYDFDDLEKKLLGWENDNE